VLFRLAYLGVTDALAVLTGGPGCGESFTIRSIVELAAAKKPRSLWSRRPGGPRNGSRN
jgi:hypothetical protein